MGTELLKFKPMRKRSKLLGGYQPGGEDTSEKEGERKVDMGREGAVGRSWDGELGWEQSGDHAEETLSPVLLDDGKGKVTCVIASESDMEISDDSASGEGGEVRENLLAPPTLVATGAGVRGVDADKLRRQNKRRRLQQLAAQDRYSQWHRHQGTVFISEHEWAERELEEGQGKLMYPRGRAVIHPAGGLLKEWARYGCPTETGENWTREQMEAAILRGPHKSAMEPAALLHFKAEVEEKVRLG